MAESDTLSTPRAGTDRRWHVLWTRSNCEQLVSEELIGKGLKVFLPKVAAWSRRGVQRERAQVPMFPGYLFLHHAMDKTTYIEVRKSRWLVSILGERWDRLAVVPDPEIEAIHRTLQAKVPVFSHPYLREGERVRITRGPLTDLEGIFVRGNPRTGLLVVSVNMLRRSVAVSVDSTLVEAA